LNLRRDPAMKLTANFGGDQIIRRVTEDKCICTLLHLRNEILHPLIHKLNILLQFGMTNKTQEDKISRTLQKHGHIWLALPRFEQTLVGTSLNRLIPCQIADGTCVDHHPRHVVRRQQLIQRIAVRRIEPIQMTDFDTETNFRRPRGKEFGKVSYQRWRITGRKLQEHRSKTRGERAHHLNELQGTLQIFIQFPIVADRLGARIERGDGALGAQGLGPGDVSQGTLAVGDRRHVCLSLPSLGVLWLVSGSRGGVRRGTELLEKGESLARQLDDPLIQGMVGIFAGTRFMVLGDWPEALARIDQALDGLEARSTGLRYWYTVALGMRMQTLESLGRLDELRAGVAKWEDEAIALKDLLSQVYASLFTALGLLAANEPVEARRRADGALTRWTTTAGFSAQHLFALRISLYTDLYEGAGPDAHERFLKAWPAMKASQLMRLQSTRLDMLHLRARVALARACARRSEQGLLHEVERDARQMEKDLRLDVKALVSLLRAGVARLQSDDAARPLFHLDQAIAGFDSAKMQLHAACARRCKGELLGGEVGRAMVEQADGLMQARGVVEPARWVAVLAPGLAG